MLPILPQVFESRAPSGFIRVEDLQKALTTYGTEKLTDEQASELVSQVRDINETPRFMLRL